MKQLMMSLLFATSLIVSPGCAVTFLPKADKELQNQIESSAKLYDTLYKQMIADPDKSFTTHEAKYQLMEELATAVLIKESARPKNDLIISQTNMLLTKVIKYRDEHKEKGNLNSAELQICMGLLQGFWKTIKDSEKFLE